MIHLDNSMILMALVNASEGIHKYCRLMESLHNTNVAKDNDFQRSFNHYYRIRQRSAEWYKTFYDLLEESKSTQLSFETALYHLFSVLGRIEPSFSSKLVATVNPDLPVWDKYVLDNLNLKWTYSGKKEARLKKAVSTYNLIYKNLNAFANSDAAVNVVSTFDDLYPEFTSKVTTTKKIDFTLWQLRS